MVRNSTYIRGDIIFSESELGPVKTADIAATPAVELTTPPEELVEAADVPVDMPDFSDVPLPTHSTDNGGTSVQDQPQAKRQKRQEQPRSPALNTRAHHKPLTPALHACITEGLFQPRIFDTEPHVTSAIVDATTTTHVPFSRTLPDPPRNLPVPVAAQTPSTVLPPFPVVTPGEPLPVPDSYKAATKSQYWPHWHKAINEEYRSMLEMGVFELVDLPPGCHAISSKWVFSWKVVHDQISRAKARIVARGFEQRESVDFAELFSPTVCQATLRMLLSYASCVGAYVHQLDVKTAFLNGFIEEDLYMVPPDGCSDGSNRVWRLLRSLYGLKQAPRQWYKRLKEELVKLGFIPSDEDQALFYKFVDGCKLFLCVHVDDMLIIHPNKQCVLDVVESLKSVFTITDLGAASNYLKVDIVTLPDGRIMLHQSDYATACVHKFLDKTNLSGSQLFGSTPLPYDFIFRKLNSPYAKSEEECVPCDQDAFRSIVGSLMYLANFTRPDLCYAVNQLCRYMHAPSLAHYRATQYVLRYIHSTHDFGLVYDTQPSTLTAFCDASFNSCPDTCRSCTGYCFLYNGALISWQSKMQSVVAISTAEAEYMSITACGREAVWLSRLYEEIVSEFVPVHIGVGEILPAYALDTTSKQVDVVRAAQKVFNDNKSAVSMVNNDHNSKLSKHIAKQHHWARERVEEGVLKYDHVSGENNVSDAFTKFLPLPVFLKHRDTMGLRSLKEMMK
jgi:hypothetical protein